MLDQQQYETLLNILQSNKESADIIKNSVALDQLKDAIISSIDDPHSKAFVDAILQNNGEVVKRAIDLVASNDQLKNAVYDVMGGKDIEKNLALTFIEQVINNIIEDIDQNKQSSPGVNNSGKPSTFLGKDTNQNKKAPPQLSNGGKPSTFLGKDTNQNKKAPPQLSNGGKPSTFLGKLNEHKGKIAISVLLTGGAVTAFVLEQPVIGAIAAVAAVIMVGILIREICKQQSATQESTLENTVGSVLDGTTLNPAAGLER